jgi:hypothetical protein
MVICWPQSEVFEYHASPLAILTVAVQ